MGDEHENKKKEDPDCRNPAMMDEWHGRSDVILENQC
jgi:hypothetical protein